MDKLIRELKEENERLKKAMESGNLAAMTGDKSHNSYNHYVIRWGRRENDRGGNGPNPKGIGGRVARQYGGHERGIMGQKVTHLSSPGV